MLNIKAFLENLTTHPGVYQMLGEGGEVLYVGKARNLKKRLSSYFSSKQKDIKTQALINRILDIQVTITHSENDALLLECNLIKKYKPHYNILFRDDKSFPYIYISEDKPYPCIDFYRGHKKTAGVYFGPYPDSTAVRQTIHIIQKLFGLRLRNDRYYAGRARPCLQYQIGLCSGSCAGLISPEDYQQDINRAILFLQGKNAQVLDELNAHMEQAAKELQFEKAAKLRDQIAKLRQIQSRQYVSSGDSDVDVIGISIKNNACIQLLIIRGGRILGSRAYFPTTPTNYTKEEILTSFITQHYLNQTDKSILPREIILDTTLIDRLLLEKTLSQLADRKISISSNVRGERKKWIEIANASADQSITSFLLNKTNLADRFHALQDSLSLKSPLLRIECFDISHTMGESTVASCVVFNREGPIKSDYRRFNIKDITPGDDLAAMQQAIFRRYQRLQAEHSKFPDLVLIDGGKTQLAAAIKVLQELNIQGIQLIGVAKGPSRKPGYETLYIPKQQPIHLDATSLALHLIQQVRDEAHRFAITGHRQQRDKKRQKSSLESIPGIGAKRRRELLHYFGGIQAIKRASLEELVKVPGISQSLAKRIFAAIHGTSI